MLPPRHDISLSLSDEQKYHISREKKEQKAKKCQEIKIDGRQLEKKGRNGRPSTGGGGDNGERKNLSELNMVNKSMSRRKKVYKYCRKYPFFLPLKRLLLCANTANVNE